MSAEDTRNHLLLVIDNLSDKYAAWVDAEATYITQEFESAIAETLEVFAGSDIPSTCRVLARTVEALEVFWNRYRAEAEQAADVNIMPGQGFFKSLEALQSLRNQMRAQPKKVLETLAMCEKQGLNDRQICILYDWVDEYGAPQMWKLAEERAEPGKHTANHVPLAEKKRLEAEAKREAVFARLKAKQAAKIAAATKPADEPWENLLATGLSATQISKMKLVHVDEVFAKADELGVPRPPLNYDVRTTTGQYDKSDDSDSAKRVKDATNTGLTKRKEEPGDNLPTRQIDDEAPAPSKPQPKRRNARKSDQADRNEAPAMQIDDEGDDVAVEYSQDTEIRTYAAMGYGARQIQAAMKPTKVTIAEIEKALSQASV